MPELAEVEYYRKCWSAGLGERITQVKLHQGKRAFRNVRSRPMQRWLYGAVLVTAESSGKQLLFRFAQNLWLGVHLGMTGKLSVAQPDFAPGKHDHLVLFQDQRALVFTDPRLFGQVRFDIGSSAPDWWSQLPPPVNSKAFTQARMDRFLRRRGKLPIKAALLLQAGFPGIGNWMADEILWRARMHPLIPGGSLDPAQSEALWQNLRFVCRGALRTVGKDFSDPPNGWLFHERWTERGCCPIHRTPLTRQTVKGRTTAWCTACQP